MTSRRQVQVTGSAQLTQLSATNKKKKLLQTSFICFAMTTTERFSVYYLQFKSNKKAKQTQGQGAIQGQPDRQHCKKPAMSKEYRGRDFFLYICLHNTTPIVSNSKTKNSQMTSMLKEKRK